MATVVNTETVDELSPWFLTRDEFSQIAQSTLTGVAASVTISSIPQKFRTLLLLIIARTDRTAELDLVACRFNADSGANYDYVYGYDVGDGTRASASAIAANQIALSLCEAANSRANVFTPFLSYLDGYYLTDHEKIINTCPHSVYGNRNVNTDFYVSIHGGAWRSSNAVTSITFFPLLGTNFVAGSIFQLYGLA